MIATILRYPSVSLPDIFIGRTSWAEIYRAMFGPLAVVLAATLSTEGRLALRYFLLCLRESSSTVIRVPARACLGVRRQQSARRYVTANTFFSSCGSH